MLKLKKHNIYNVLLSTLMLFSVSCARINILAVHDSLYVDSAFDKIYSDFVTIGEHYGTKMPKTGAILVDDDLRSKPQVLGSCIHLGNTRLITISKSFWMKASPLEREETLFHELGHCILNRPHCFKKNELNEPVSIMYPSILNKNLYERNRQKFIHELFRRRKDCP